MFCKNCGNQIPDGVRFCPKCGKVTGAVLSNQSAINQNAANKNLMGHTATGKSTMDSDTIRSEKTTQSGWSGEISEASAIKKSKTKKQRYLRAYNLGHFGVLIGCVMEIVAVFLPNYTNGFLIGFLNKFTDFMGDSPFYCKLLTTFVFGENARKLTGYLDTELRNVEIYQSFRDYTSTAAIMLVVMGILVLVSFICVLLKRAPVISSVFNLAAIGVLLYVCSKLTSVFQGQGYLLLLAGGVVIFVSSVISSMMTSNMLMRQRVQLTKY